MRYFGHGDSRRFIASYDPRLIANGLTNMPRQLLSIVQRRRIAERLQRIVDTRYGVFHRFQAELRQNGLESLASTIRGWLPPQDKWKKDPKRGSKVLRRDWACIRAPDVSTLLQFCEATGARSDYLLFGSGPPFRDQAAEVVSLGAELRAEAGRRLSAKAKRLLRIYRIDDVGLIRTAVSSLNHDLEAVNSWLLSLHPLIRSQATRLLTVALRLQEVSGVDSKIANIVLAGDIWESSLEVRSEFLAKQPSLKTGRIGAVPVPSRMRSKKGFKLQWVTIDENSHFSRDFDKAVALAIVTELRDLGLSASQTRVQLQEARRPPLQIPQGVNGSDT